jgi:anti-sigma factor RsiW
MSDLGEKLSAYLDGALSPAEAAGIEARLMSDPDLRAEFEALEAANRAAEEEFAAMLAIPVPLAMARAIETAPARAAPAPLPPRRAPAWLSLAAGLGLLAVGSGGGYMLGQRQAVPAPADWVADVAAYHAIYARQERHLVEVAANEADHIRTWFASQTGIDAPIPDFSAQGLEFQGARLLVAAGQPVAQLMYRDAQGIVVALCFTASDKPPTDSAAPRAFEGFDALVWGKPGARFVLIGPEGDPRLPALAEQAIDA